VRAFFNSLRRKKKNPREQSKEWGGRETSQLLKGDGGSEEEPRKEATILKLVGESPRRIRRK